MDETLHFLVVDDDAESRATLVEYLRMMGFNNVTLAHDGSEAIRLLDRDATINFIISDWDMPLMNGLTLLQRIKFNPSRSHIPFLVVTSPISVETEKVVLAAENLVDGYLIKPFRSVLLKDKIQKILTVSSLGPKKQVIVVDDDDDARETIVEYLKQIGFKDILSFSDPTEALKHVDQFPAEIGLIVSDWEMPKVSGIDLLRACKTDKSKQGIPFLMVTSQSSIERMKVMQAVRANVDHYLLKPFNLDDFRARIRNAVEQSKSSGEVRKLTAEAAAAFDQGNYQEAYIKLERILKLQPNNEATLIAIADAAAQFKGLQAAAPFYKKAIDVNPLQAKTYLKLANVYEVSNMIDRAIALLQSAVQNVGFNSELHFNLGKLYSKNGFFDEAIRELEKTLEIQVDHPEAKLMIEALQIQKRGLPK